MYAASSFREERLPVLHQFIRDHPFACVVSANAQGVQASHIPLVLEEREGTLGVLHGHLARANQHWQSLADGEVLAIFQGPHAYISPSWYASKKEHGRVVPTWNYLAVHACGHARVFDDAKSLRAILELLTHQQESKRSEPWKVSDAPDDYIENTSRGIVGFALTLTRLEGIWKMSQNRPDADRVGVVAGLRQGAATDREVAEYVERLREGK